jgi:hypothetical protein
MTVSPTPTTQILSALQIRGGEAAWVLSAHVYALLVPLVFCVAVIAHWDYLVTTTYQPSLFFVAACLLSAGGAFEAAQNTMDSWYLTADSPSANGLGLCDFMFYLLVTAGQAVSAVAIAGDRWWVVAVAVAAVLSVPPVYFRNGPYVAPLSVSSLLAIGLAFEAFGDPAVFLQLLGVAATMFFFSALLRTQAQSLHGFTTVAASSGAWFLIWAIAAGSRGASTSWLLVAAITAAALTAGLLLRPVLYRLPPSPRAVTLAA